MTARFSFSRLFIAAIAVSGLAACAAETDTDKETHLDPVVSDPLNMNFVDTSGAVLNVDCTQAPPDVVMSAGTTDDFSVLARIRFQGGGADEKFRTALELGDVGQDWWTFDEELQAYEVGFGIAFMRSLALAERVFVELQPSDSEPLAAVFDISEDKRELIAFCLQSNSDRVEREMVALGITPADEADSYAKYTAAFNAPIDRDLYYMFMETLALAQDADLFPDPTEADQAAMRSGFNPLRPLTSYVAYYKKAYPAKIKDVEEFVVDYGFATLDDWLATGDRFQAGMNVTRTNRDSPGWLATSKILTVEELSDGDPERQKMWELYFSFTSDELQVWNEEYDRYQQLVN